MKNKLLNIVWLTALALISFPSGFAAIFVRQPTLPKNEYAITFIMSGIICMIILGSLSGVVYIISRKTASAAPFKRAAQVYTFFVVGLLLFNSSRFPEAIKERDREYLLRNLETDLVKEYADNAAKLPREVVEKSGLICTCIIAGLRKRDALVDSMLTVKVQELKQFILNSPEVKKITGDCNDLFVKIP